MNECKQARTSADVDWQIEARRRETFRFLAARFDVTEAKRLIVAAPRELSEARVSELAEWLGMIGIEDHLVEDADTSVPLIVATLEDPTGDFHLPIDGWHRVARAVRDGLKRLPLVLLTAEETQQIRR